MIATRLAAVLGLASLLLTPATWAQDDVPPVPPRPPEPGVIIGAVLPLTGPLAPFGRSAHAAMEVAADAVNESGGIAGRRIDLRVADSEGQPGTALVVAADLIDNKGAIALLGPLTSAAARPIAVKLAVRRGVPMVAIGATARGLEALGDSGLVFRILPGDAHQAVALANYAINLAGRTHLSCLFLRNSFGANMAQTYVLWAEQRQLETGACLPYDPDTNIASLEEALAEQPGEALLIVGAAPDAVGLVARLAEGSEDRLLLLSEGLRDRSLIGALSPAAQARVAAAGAFIDREGPAWADVVGAARERQVQMQAEGDGTGDPVDGLPPSVVGDESAEALIAAASFDAMITLALALEQRTANPESSLRDAIITVSAPPGEKMGPASIAAAFEAVRAGTDIDYDGASGPIDLDRKGEPVSLIGIWRIRDGAFSLERVFRSFRAD